MEDFFGIVWPSWETTTSPLEEASINVTLSNASFQAAEVIVTTLSTVINKDHGDHFHNHHDMDASEVTRASVIPDFNNTQLFDDFNSTQPFNETGNMTDVYAPPQLPQWYIILQECVKYGMTVSIIIIMLGMGCAIYWRDVIKNLWPPFGIIIGLVGQFVILPATAFGYSLLFGLNSYEAIGGLIVSCCPGGSFSNFFTFWVEGELALSIVMTTFSSVLALGGMPLNLFIYSGYFLDPEDKDNLQIPYLKIIVSLVMVVAPVIVGMIIRHFTKKHAERITNIVSKFGMVAFVVILTCYIVLYYKAFFESSSLLFAAATLLPITGFILAYIAALICKRSHKVCRTIGIETSSQNMPIALSIILFSFPPSPERASMSLFPLIYGIFLFVEMFVIVFIYKVVTRCRQRYARPTEETKNPYLTSATLLESGTVDERRKMNP